MNFNTCFPVSRNNHISVFHKGKLAFFLKKESVTSKRWTLAQELLFFHQTYKSRFSYINEPIQTYFFTN